MVFNIFVLFYVMQSWTSAHVLHEIYEANTFFFAKFWPGPQVTFFNIWLRRFRLDQNPIESEIIFSAVSTTLGVKANFQKHGFSQKKKVYTS